MESHENAPVLRTRIYVDGYNFYYGCLKGTPYKWLDMMVLFEQHVLPSILVQVDGKPAQSKLNPLAIKYFTAMILEKAAKAADSVSCQARYHSALRKVHPERIQIVEGYYSLLEAKAKIVDAENPDKWPRECQEILIWKLEEKKSDVSLALQAYHDAMTGEVDQVVIVTNDTDISPALKMIRDHTKVVVGLVVPTRKDVRIPNTELADVSHWVRSHITDVELEKSQFPRVIPGRKATVKPESWFPVPREILERVLALAAPIRGGKGKAFNWLETPNPYLGGEIPLKLIETEEGAERVIAYMQTYIAEMAEKSASGKDAEKSP